MTFSEAFALLCRLVPLGPWLDLAERAGVPYIPAEFSAPVPTRQLLAALDGEECPELEAAIAWAQERLDHDAGLMARWECCTSEDLKYVLSHAIGEPSDAARVITVDDPRLHDCTVGTETRLCVRPWTEPLRVDGYPVEFRVFFGLSGWEGTSNYYPQRALPEDFAGAPMPASALANACLIYASQLYRASRDGFFLGFTADFLLAADGRLLFLEGGPPHQTEWPGAPASDPCCHAEGHIRGLALAANSG